MTLRRSSPELLTVSGSAPASSTTSEQVASKPTPLTAEGAMAASAIALRTEAAQAAQISDDDCSTTLPASCQTVIGCRAVASRLPVSSNTPARALDVPTSMPMKACRIATPSQISTSSPARIAAIDEDDAPGHQACGVGRQKQHDGGNFIALPHPGHRRAADPGIVHLRVAFDECIEGRRDVSRRHGIDAHAARAPLGRERLREMVHCGLRSVVVALLLRLVDDEAGHRTDVDNGTRLCLQHVLAEGTTTPERSIEIDVDDVEPMFVGYLLGRCLASRNACIIDEDIDPAVTGRQLIGDLGDTVRVRYIHNNGLAIGRAH